MAEHGIGTVRGFMAGRAARRPGGWLARLLHTEALWRSRRRLAVLDDAALQDLGLTREEALNEAHKPVWNVPAHWLR